MKVTEIENTNGWEHPKENVWYKIISQDRRQIYHEKSCVVCKARFAASHSRVTACGRSCAAIARGVGEKSHFWRGGRFVDSRGYVHILRRDHPFSTKPNYYILEHRLVMEKTIGRFLKKEEIVHHRNGIKHDNRPENLHLWNQSDHVRHHNKLNQSFQKHRQKKPHSSHPEL